ncbi:putative tRNA(His) guanylyltransferase [Bienertia sinuspersici]
MFSDAFECYVVIVEEIHADQSGRSFFMKLLDGLRNFQASSSTMTTPWADVRVDGVELGRNIQSSIFVKPLRTRQCSGQMLKGNTPYQVSRGSFMTKAILKLYEEVKPSGAFTNNVPLLNFLESLGNCSFPESASSTA